MPVLQPIHRKGSRQRNQARNLIAGAQQPAPYVIAATEECDAYPLDVTVVPCKSRKLQQRAGVTLVPGQHYWMVRSPKFTLRWYVVTKNVKTDEWTCSSRDERIRQYCVKQVEQFISARKQRRAA